MKKEDESKRRDDDLRRLEDDAKRRDAETKRAQDQNAELLVSMQEEMRAMRASLIKLEGDNELLVNRNKEQTLRAQKYREKAIEAVSQ